MSKSKVDETLSKEISVLDSLLDPTARLAKKYLLDAKGQLKLYHPITQRCLWAILTGEDFDLMTELQEYHTEKKGKKDCDKPCA